MSILSRVFTRGKTVVSAGNHGALFAGPTRSGALVNEQSALGLSALWCGIRTISQDLGCLEPRVYSEDANGVRKLQKGHPLNALLCREPNPEMTALTFRETMQAHALMWGAAYAEIQRDGSGRPVALWPIHPQQVQVYRESETGVLSYRVTLAINGGPPGSAGKQVELAPQNMLVINGLSPDGSVGYRLLTTARESIGFGIASQNYGASFFRNACRPSGTLETPQQLSVQARENLRDSYNQLHSGADNTGKLMLLEEGLKFSPLQLTNEQSQYKDILNWWVYEIARYLVIPPPKLMALEKATWANLTELNRAYLNDCLRPWLERWEAEIERKLLLPGERDSLYIEFDTSTLLRADEATRYANYDLALAGKPWRTVNEVRAAENLGPLEDGDELEDTALDVAEDAKEEQDVNATATDDVGMDTTAQPHEATATTDAAPQDAAPAPVADVATLALNGTQITSLALICDKIASGEWPKEAGKLAIQASFPSIPEALVDGLVASLATVKHEAPAVAVPHEAQPHDAAPAQPAPVDSAEAEGTADEQ